MTAVRFLLLNRRFYSRPKNWNEQKEDLSVNRSDNFLKSPVTTTGRECHLNFVPKQKKRSRPHLNDLDHKPPLGLNCQTEAKSPFIFLFWYWLRDQVSDGLAECYCFASARDGWGGLIVRMAGRTGSDTDRWTAFTIESLPRCKKLPQFENVKTTNLNLAFSAVTS